MIMVEPKIQIIEGDNLTRIFKAGTTCYRSEETTKKTPEEFAQMLIQRGHTAMLEHSLIVVKEADCELSVALNVILEAFATEFGRPSMVTRMMGLDGETGTSVDFYVGTVRAWRELLEFNNKHAADDEDWYFVEFSKDPLMANVGTDLNHRGEKVIDLSLNVAKPDEDFDVFDEHCRIVTAKFTTSRAVALEAFRHRLNAADYEPVDLCPPMCISPSMESTRYVDEAKGDIAFVKPWWWDNPNVKNWIERKAERVAAWEDSERHYKRDRELGGAPQAARGMLAEDVRTEIVLTATVANWKLWLKQRADRAAHPDIRILANLFMDATGIRPDDWPAEQ